MSARVYWYLPCFGVPKDEKKFGMLPTHHARGVEAPKRELKAFSRRTLALPDAKIRVRHFVAIPSGYTSFCPFP